MVQPENDLASTASLDSSNQTQQVEASQSVSSSAPTSNMCAKRSARQSPKRARDEDDDDDEPAFGTPPPKQAANKANGKAAPKKAPTLKKPATKKPVPKKAVAPPPTRSQPSRNRKAPGRFEDLEEKTTPKALPTKKGPSKVFDPIFITTNSTSRLVKADIYHMLLEGSAWTSLSAEQQNTLVSMLPEDTASQTLLAKINAGDKEGTRPSAFTLANDCFRTDVAKFQEDLKNGHLAKTWQAAAEQAVIERAAGEYDAWKVEEAESWWGQKSK
ncbi:Asx homology domain-like protein [Stemphylium lycopersici]|uniref:Asx homology domain-like protein n=1 Tax=Stemphylium lycopersici TaxID=183478 RepID=A0A364N861_STELY|nr:Asx homology domain-like protein [Stemphylium lycopersici]